MVTNFEKKKKNRKFIWRKYSFISLYATLSCRSTNSDIQFSLIFTVYAFHCRQFSVDNLNVQEGAKTLRTTFLQCHLPHQYKRQLGKREKFSKLSIALNSSVFSVGRHKISPLDSIMFTSKGLILT